MSLMNQFYTREACTTGKRVYLSQPDGTPTDEWIHVIGVDSDIFQKAQHRHQQKLREMVGSEPEKIAERSLDLLRGLQASLVTDWSFEDMPCTPENVAKFFREAPQIAEMVDRLANQRKFFLTESTSGSSDTPKENANSPESQKGQE